VHAGLETCLHTAAQNADGRIAPAEFAHRHGGRRRGADVGEVSAVGEERQWFAGFGGGEQHHAVAAGTPARHVAGKGTGDFQCEIPSAAPVTRLDVHLSIPRRDPEVHGHRRIAFAARAGYQGVTDHFDQLGIDQQLLDFSETNDPHWLAFY